MRLVTVSGSLIVLLVSIASLGSAGQQSSSQKSEGREISLALSSNVNKADADGTTRLHQAVQSNDLTRVRQLIRAGADVKRANRYGVTPLSLAAVSGNGAMVAALLKAGADANTVAGESETVLMSAARSGHVDVVNQLLAQGANPDAREGWQGQTALMWAAAENHPDVVQTLLEHGADPNASADILEYWAMTPAEEATPKVNTPKGGMAVLHYAARQGRLEAVRALASARGIDLNRTDPDGVNALLYATLNGHYDVAAYLIEKGADPNLADQYGRSLLYAALDMNRLERGEPRPAPKSNDAIRPLELARLALAKGANPNAQITRRPPGRCPLDCQAAGIEGATPMWRAAKGNDVNAVKLLLAAGADPLMPARDGSFPLMMAAGQGWRDNRSVGTDNDSIDTIKVLLATALVDINEMNAAGETALHAAATRGSDAVVKFLVESGARLDIKDKANRTALDTAMGVPSRFSRSTDQYHEPPVRESTAKVLRELMVAKGVPIEPYTRADLAAGRAR
jgi:ankyrin repeat protein